MIRFQQKAVPEGIRFAFSGDLEDTACGCLLAFWDQRIRGRVAGPLVLDLSELESIDAQSVAILTSLLTDYAESPEATGPEGPEAVGHPHIRLLQPPQLLAHTLYKLGRLADGSIAIETRPSEEPYAG